MPISFRTYNDPGVYIESITPPVVFTSAIEPTIVAIVGEAPTSRSAVDSANLTTGSWYDLTTLGGEPSSVNVTDRLLGTQYVSAGVADLDAAVTDVATAWTVSTFANVDLAALSARTILVTLSSYGAGDSFTFTINNAAAAASATGSVTFGSNHTAAGIKAILEAHASIQTANVYATTDASTFAVEFVDPTVEQASSNAGASAPITINGTGCTGVVANAFLAQVEDEVIAFTTVAEGAAQAWVASRGVGSTAVLHGIGQVINTIESYSTGSSVEVASIDTPISETATQFTTTEGFGAQTVTLTGYDGVESFTLTYGGQTTGLITRGTNYSLLGIKAALELLSNVTQVQVTSLTDTLVLADTGFTVRFLNPNTAVTALTFTPTAGHTAVVANRGIANDTYLDVEGERMLVTAVSGSAPQTVTVVRGVGGTTADSHGATEVYENTGADILVKVGAGEDALYETDDDELSIKILDSARVSNGSFVNVALEATDSSQFDATLFTDMDEIRDKYGDPLDASGSINSPLTLAAQIALANGATQLVLVGTDANNTVQEGIDKLEFRQDVNSVVILSGSVAGAGSNDIAYLKGHVEQMSDNGVLRRAFVGIDGVLTTAPTYSDYVSKAAIFNSERVSLVAPSRIKLDNGTGTPILVGGQYMAAAVAGLQAGQVPQEPLTRKQVFGFVGIDDQDSTNNVFRMQAGGVLVVFEDRLGRLIIKHGLTTDMTSVYTREISVITARDRLRDFVLETLEGGALIGSPMTNETPNLVLAAVNSALEEAMLQGLIFDYGEVKFRFPTENPTLIQVRFAYKPTLPLNYIHVQFNIDTDTGTIEFQSINDNTSQPTT